MRPLLPHPWQPRQHRIPVVGERGADEFVLRFRGEIGKRRIDSHARCDALAAHSLGSPYVSRDTGLVVPPVRPFQPASDEVHAVKKIRHPVDRSLEVCDCRPVDLGVGRPA
jgi:hypothetical protein